MDLTAARKIAQEDCEQINKSEYLWAELESNEHRVSIKVGSIWMGRKEIWSHRIDYLPQRDGSIYKHYAPGL